MEELLETPVTTASRTAEPWFKAPATVRVVTEEDIQRYGLRDLKDVLRVIPGVEWSFDQMALQGGLRGFSSNFSNVLLMINGREVQNLLAGEAFISYQFRLHNVERVEVMMGPGSALYGPNAFVGVINIITKRNDPSLLNGGYVEQAAGSWNTLSTGVVYQATSSEASVYGAINFFTSDNEDLGDWLSENSDTWRSRAQAWTRPEDNPKFAYRNEARSALVEAEAEYHGFYAGVLLIHNYSEGGFEQIQPVFGQRMLRREQFLWYAGWRRDLADTVAAKIEFLNFTENIDDFFISTSPEGITHPIPPDQEINQFGDASTVGFFGYDDARKYQIDAQVEWQLHPTNLLIAGTTLEHWDLGTGPLCCTGISLIPSNNTDLILVPNEDLRKFNKAGFYVQDRQDLWDRLYVTAGVRLDTDSNFGEQVNPRVGIVTEGWPGSTFRMIMARAYREPNIFEVASDETFFAGRAPGTEDPLRSAKLTTAEFSYGQTVGPTYLETSVYTNQVDDAIVANPDFTLEPGEREFINASAKSHGIEQIVQLRMTRWQAFGSYAFVDRANFVDPVNDLESNALGISQHKFIIGASVDVYRELYLSAYNVWNSSADDTAIPVNGEGLEILNLPPYNNLTLTVGARDLQIAGLRVDASAIFDNVLNRDNLKPNIRATDPRAYIQNHFNVLGVLRARL